MPRSKIKPKSKAKANGKRKGKSEKCATLCRPAVLTKQGCICTSDVVHKKGKVPWCFVKCPAGRERAVRRDILFRRWDDVPILESKKERLLCARGDARAYGTCKKGDAERTENTTGALLVVITALKLISSLYVKAQSTDAQTLHSLSLFHKRSVQELVGRDALSKERGDELIREFNDAVTNADSPGDAYKQILTGLRDGLPQKEASPILDFVIENVPADDLGDFLRGGQLQFEDGGELYKKITETQKAYPRFSSHHPQVKNVAHHAVNEKLFDSVFHILGGTTADGQSWIQAESSPWPGGLTCADVFYSALEEPHYFRDILDHGLDFIVHKLTHKNVGPFGSTKRGEWNPIVLREALPKRRQLQLEFPTSENVNQKLPGLMPQPSSIGYLPGTIVALAALPQIAGGYHGNGKVSTSKLMRRNTPTRASYYWPRNLRGGQGASELAACEDILCAKCLHDKAAFNAWRLKNYPDKLCPAAVSGTPADVANQQTCYAEATERYRVINSCVEDLKKAQPKPRFPLADKKCAMCEMPISSTTPPPPPRSMYTTSSTFSTAVPSAPTAFTPSQPPPLESKFRREMLSGSPRFTPSPPPPLPSEAKFRRETFRPLPKRILPPWKKRMSSFPLVPRRQYQLLRHHSLANSRLVPRSFDPPQVLLLKCARPLKQELPTPDVCSTSVKDSVSKPHTTATDKIYWRNFKLNIRP